VVGSGNDPARRAQRRREHLARRVRVGGVLVAAHLPAHQHGTPSASDYYGCRCTVCAAADLHRHRQQWYQRKKQR
jgi:hypothetical protein